MLLDELSDRRSGAVALGRSPDGDEMDAQDEQYSRDDFTIVATAYARTEYYYFLDKNERGARSSEARFTQQQK